MKRTCTVTYGGEEQHCHKGSKQCCDDCNEQKGCDRTCEPGNCKKCKYVECTRPLVDKIRKACFWMYYKIKRL